MLRKVRVWKERGVSVYLLPRVGGEGPEVEIGQKMVEGCCLPGCLLPVVAVKREGEIEVRQNVAEEILPLDGPCCRHAHPGFVSRVEVLTTETVPQYERVIEGV